jgi:ribosomal protein L40E
MNVRICLNCGKQNPEDAWSCQVCGETLPEESIVEIEVSEETSNENVDTGIFCPSCKQRNSATNIYCFECGTALRSLPEMGNSINEQPEFKEMDSQITKEQNQIILLENVHQLLVDIKDNQSKMLLRLSGISQNVQESRVDISAETFIKDVEMPFFSMVIFMVKWAIASIPAAIILILISLLFWGCFGSALLAIISGFLRDFSF